MSNTMELNCQNDIQAGAPDTSTLGLEKAFLTVDADISLWDSLESDTESLAQERRYQTEFKTRIRQANEMVNPTNGEGEELEHSGEERDDENYLEEFAENRYFYDSLDVAAPQEPINTLPHDTEVGEILQEKRQEMLGYGPAEHEYAALLYDRNWRTNLKGEGLVEEGNQLLLEEESSSVYADPCDGSPRMARDHYRNREKESHSAHQQAPAVGFVVNVGSDCCSESKSKPPPTPYYPSPQSVMVAGAETAVSEQRRHRQALHRPEDTASNTGAKPAPAAGNRTLSGETQAPFHELEESYEEVNGRYAKEYQLFYERESARLNWSRRLSNMRQTKLKMDIVEQNKITLGIRKKQASYLCAHSPKGVKEDHTNKQELEAVEEITQHQYLVPELRWQQKTQRLKIHREKKKGKREGLPIPHALDSNQSERVHPSILQDRCPARVHGCRQQPGRAKVLVIDEADHGDTSLSEAVPCPQWQPDRPLYSMNTPTVNLNINLSASGDMAQFLGQEHRHTSLKFSSHYGPSLGTRPDLLYNVSKRDHCDPAQLAHYGPGYIPAVPQPGLPGDWFPGQPISGNALLQQGSRRPRAVPPLWDQDSRLLPGMDSDHVWMAVAMCQPADERNQYLSLGDQHGELQPQHSASYTVLPPIGEAVARESELSSRNTWQKINGMHRSSSEGYLAQMEKQKHLKEKATYKEYTLKDYKALKQDVKLGGLGPNYEVTPITAEKIRQRQRYSDKVRERNKNINRIPFLPARNSGGGDAAEDMVPRRKALEYARRIPKPKPPAEPKSGESAGVNNFLHERAQYLEHLDLSQLARLEMLQKRHEEEKQVVAHFKALRAV